MPGPLMECGHSAQGVDDNGNPVCVVCVGIDPGARMVHTDPPDLSSRLMRCSYLRGQNGQPCDARTNPRPSDTRAAFFAHKPDQEFDEFYCGCWGWD